jgi:hypothetical protein
LKNKIGSDGMAYIGVAKWRTGKLSDEPTIESGMHYDVNMVDNGYNDNARDDTW